MKIVKVEPKDICVTVDFSLEQLYFIQQYLGRCVCKYVTEEYPFMEKAAEYVEKNFMPVLNEFMEEMGKDV